MSTTSSNINKKDTRITAEQTIILIRLIKKYRSLWDANHPDFRNRTIRKGLYERIGSYFGVSEEEVRRKFCRIQNCYKQELKQIRNDKKRQPTLFYFDEMEFLGEQIEQRQLKRRLSSGSGASSAKDEGDTEGDHVQSFEELYTLEPEPEDCQPFNETTDSISGVVTEEFETDELLGDEENEHTEQHSNPPKEKDDEFDLFTRYLASQLREMDKLSALETMEELQQIISRRRISILKRDMKMNTNTEVQYRYTLKRSKRNGEVDVD